MSQTTTMAKFPIGRLVIATCAAVRLTTDDVLTALARHMDGDWGDISEEYWKSNDEALELGARLISIYHAADGTKFWVITEWDRSATTMVLPEEY